MRIVVAAILQKHEKQKEATVQREEGSRKRGCFSWNLEMALVNRYLAAGKAR